MSGQRSPSSVACSSQAELAGLLAARGWCSAGRVTAALQQVDRCCFVPKAALRNQQDLLYQPEEPLAIGYGQFTSAPQVHAKCLELLQYKLQPGSTALDAGAGSGYMTACMALLVGPSGRVLAVEKVPELAEAAAANIDRCIPGLLNAGTVHVVAGNVLEGLESLQQEAQQFDAIHVGAAIDEVPESLVALLKPGGRMVLPYGPRWASQVLMVVDKDHQGACLHREVRGEVQCVPLWRPLEMEDGFNGGGVACAMHLQLKPPGAAGSAGPGGAGPPAGSEAFG